MDHGQFRWIVRGKTGIIIILHLLFFLFIFLGGGGGSGVGRIDLYNSKRLAITMYIFLDLNCDWVSFYGFSCLFRRRDIQV